MDRSTLLAAAVVLAGSIWLAGKLWPYLPRPRIKTGTDKYSPGGIGSDMPPPAGTIAFNAAILDACGSRVSDSFKLKLLAQPDITIAQALKLAREEVEKGTPAA